MSGSEKVILSEKYYLDNFKYLLNFVKKRYQSLLSQKEKQFIDAFSELSEDAQCLYVRISNRKGKFFLIDKLTYVEITSIRNARKELINTGFILHLPDLELDEYFQLMTIYIKPVIVRKVKDRLLGMKLTTPKPDLILLTIETIDPLTLKHLFYEEECVITQSRIEELDMIKLLFFGTEYGSMTDFVVRDVGHAQFKEIDESQLGFSFDTRMEAEAAMDLSLHHKDFNFLEINESPLIILKWFHQLNITHYLSLDKVKNRALKLIHKVGYCLEKSKYLEEALDVYSLSSSSPMRERSIRIFNKQKNYNLAVDLANKILESPNDTKEYYIAIDTLNKLDKKIKLTTKRQKKGIHVSIGIEFKTSVEQGVLNYYQQLGYQGIHSENTLFSSLFGLCFWDEIFDPKHHAIHQPLQHTPSDFKEEDFYIKRKEAIGIRLQKLSSTNRIMALINKRIEENEGITNRFVLWDNNLLLALKKLIEVLKPKQIQAILSAIAIDPKNRLSGFPDLFVWKKTDIWFYEVKSPNDHLSEKQLFWLEHFKSIKVKSEIILVEWN